MSSKVIQPALVTLEYTPEVENDIDMRAILRRIQISAPRLQTLRLGRGSRYETIDAELSQTIISLNHLTTFRFSFMPPQPDALIHLSRLPGLTTVGLLFKESNLDTWGSPIWGGFPALNSLRLNSSETIDNPVPAASFLHLLSGLALTSLHLLFGYALPTSVEDFGWLISAVAHLRHLQICSISFGISSEWGDIVIDGSVLSPLYQISGMRDFALEDVPIVFQPEAVRDLADAWRHLQCLLLPTFSEQYYQLHLEDLSFFARSCHVLDTINVQLFPIDNDWVCDAEISYPLSPLSNLGLKRTSISPLAADAVATYLAKTFPSAVVEHTFPRLWWLEMGLGYQERMDPEMEAGMVIRRINKLKDKLVQGFVYAQTGAET